MSGGGFEVNVGLRRENALSQLLFIAVVELTNRSIRTKNMLQKLFYADDLAVVVELEADLSEEQLVATDRADIYAQ